MAKNSQEIIKEDVLQHSSTVGSDVPPEAPKPWWHAIKEPGSALQIVVAAILAIAIGLAVTTTVKEIPDAAPTLLAIPGNLWLRSLKAVVLPLIVTAMILAVQKLREMSSSSGTGSGHILARWTIGYYVITTLFAIIHSSILVGLVWSKLFTVADEDSLAVSEEDAEMVAEREEVEIPDVVVTMFESLIPANIVEALAENSLLAVLVTSVVVGYLIEDPEGPLLRLVKEIEKIVTKVITFLIKLAPIGVFFLILPNLFKLDIQDIGQNLGVLIGATICGLAIHLFIVLPAIFFIVVRKNPFTYWIKNSPAWITAWGSASSAATLPVTLKCARARGLPLTITQFALPLGCLVNMDGTAIYFPVVVVFLASTQGMTLSAADYIIIILLSTLASIGTTPIPSSSLVLTVMIAGAVNVPVTGMYAVVVAIDWFLDRFRTAVNVSGDLYAAKCITKLTKITDPHSTESEIEEVKEMNSNSDRV